MTLQVIKDILREMGVMETTLHDQATIHEEIGLDSSEVVLLAVELKKRLGVRIELTGWQDVSLEQLARRVDGKLADKAR